MVHGRGCNPHCSLCPSLIEIGSKTAEKNSAQIDRQTNRHYENTGHLAVNQYSQQHEQAAEYGHRLQLTVVFHVNLGQLVPRHFLLPPVLKENLWVIMLQSIGLLNSSLPKNKLIVFMTL